MVSCKCKLSQGAYLPTNSIRDLLVNAVCVLNLLRIRPSGVVAVYIHALHWKEDMRDFKSLSSGLNVCVDIATQTSKAYTMVAFYNSPKTHDSKKLRASKLSAPFLKFSVINWSRTLQTHGRHTPVLTYDLCVVDIIPETRIFVGTTGRWKRRFFAIPSRKPRNNRTCCIYLRYTGDRR